jgi:hypothetical protein
MSKCDVSKCCVLSGCCLIMGVPLLIVGTFVVWVNLSVEDWERGTIYFDDPSTIYDTSYGSIYNSVEISTMADWGLGKQPVIVHYPFMPTSIMAVNGGAVDRYIKSIKGKNLTGGYINKKSIPPYYAQTGNTLLVGWSAMIAFGVLFLIISLISCCCIISSESAAIQPAIAMEFLA